MFAWNGRTRRNGHLIGKKPTEQKRLQVYVAKKLHVYCVIILKLMADHTKSAIRMVALHTLHAYKARVLGTERKSCFPMSLTSSSSSSSRDKNKYGGIWFMLQTKRFTVPSLYSDIYFCSERTTMTSQTSENFSFGWTSPPYVTSC